MAEEFQECEVMFQEEYVVEGKETQWGNDENNGCIRGGKRKKLKKDGNGLVCLSIPINIPDGKQWYEYVDSDIFGGGDEFVPPHLIIRQRLVGEMKGFSVCIGKGRTLKGRDLRQVRNSILRMTGFLES